VLRYRTGETDDGLSGKEGTFVICSFWLVSAKPRHLAATPRSSTAPTARPRGNFPLAFSHLALLDAAARIILTKHLAEL
jgi:GH15 family glucan-1,4-alpha-glucosidase